MPINKTAAQRLDSFYGDTVQLETQISKAFKKKAGDLSYDAAYDASRVPLNYQDPLYDAYLIMFPEYNLVEANKRYRHYYKFHPILGNCVDIHATFPFTDFELMVDNEEIKEYYTYLADKYDLTNMNIISARDETLLGEAVFLGNWDSVNLEWEEWIQYPPEFIDITTVPGMSKRVFTVKPDPEMKDMLNNKDNTEANKILIKILKKINSKYFKAASDNEPYNIPEERIIYLANKVDGYSKRGYALTKRVLQDLMHETDLRTLQHTFTQRHTFPIKLWKLGSESLGWVPSQKHYANFKKLLVQACFSDDTEFLTENGFKLYKDIKDGEKLATVNPETLNLEYKNFTKRFEYDWDENGELNYFNNKPKSNISDKELIEIAKTLKNKHNLSLPKELFNINLEQFKIFFNEFLKGRNIFINKTEQYKSIRFRSLQLAEDLEKLMISLGYRIRISKHSCGIDFNWKEHIKEMIRFKHTSLDLLVTPNHNMFIADYNNGKQKWHLQEASSIFNCQMLSRINDYNSGYNDENITIGNFTLKTKDYATLVGYIASEGCLDSSNKRIGICQSLIHKETCNFITETLNNIKYKYKTHESLYNGKDILFGKEYIRKNSINIKIGEPIMKDWVIHKSRHNNFVVELLESMTTEKGHTSYWKCLPIQAKQLSKKYLKYLLWALIDGDGSFNHNKKSKYYKENFSNIDAFDSFNYYTCSEQLAKDVQEIALKLGYSSSCNIRGEEYDEKRKFLKKYYRLCFSKDKNIEKRSMPVIKSNMITREKYNGKVVCFEVPPYHTIIVRRKGRIVVCGQCSDPDFNLVYHFGVQFEAVGTKDKIENLQPQFEFTTKRILNGFYINDALLNGEAPSYAGQVANTKLLMYRFTAVRNEREKAYRNKIFLPIARQQQLIKQSNGEKKALTMVKSKNFRDNQYYLPEFMWRQQNVTNNYQLQQQLIQLYNDGAIPFGIISDILGLSDKILESYRKKEQGTYANRLTREIVDEMVKADPSLSLKFALGEDPVELLKNKVKNLDQMQDESNNMNGEDNGLGDEGGFDSRAPIDLGGDPSEDISGEDLGNSSENESKGEAPMSETGEPPANDNINI